MVEAVPEPGQFLPVEEDHEVRQYRIAIDAALADLAHQIHAHGIAAEREEGAVAERENAAIAPDEIERQRQQRIAEILAEQRHEIGRDVQRIGLGQQQIGERHQDGSNNDDQGDDQGLLFVATQEHLR